MFLYYHDLTVRFYIDTARNTSVLVTYGDLKVKTNKCVSSLMYVLTSLPSIYQIFVWQVP